jgi:hypothetical protein
MASKQEALRIIGGYFAERDGEPAAPLEQAATTRLTQACGLIDRFAPEGSSYRALKEKAINTKVVGGFGTRSASVHLQKVEAVLKGLEDDIAKDRIALPSEIPVGALSRIEHVLSRFHKVARRLVSRHGSSKPLKMEDEYDVQYLLNALLAVDFDDVRPEEWTPSYAGSSGKRMDFLVKQDGIVVEVKRTRDTLKAKDVGDQLIIDIAHYKTHQDCQTLVCFVYDPDQLITNPIGLKKDLEQLTTAGMIVRVVICQG